MRARGSAHHRRTPTTRTTVERPARRYVPVALHGRCRRARRRRYRLVAAGRNGASTPSTRVRRSLPLRCSGHVDGRLARRPRDGRDTGCGARRCGPPDAAGGAGSAPRARALPARARTRACCAASESSTSSVVSTSRRFSFRPSISRWMSSSRAWVFSQQQLGSPFGLADDAFAPPPRRCAWMSSDSRCAVISVSCRFVSCSRCWLSGASMLRRVPGAAVGFAEGLFVVVGDGGMSSDVTSTLSKPRNVVRKRCWRRSRGLTFMRRPPGAAAYRRDGCTDDSAGGQTSTWRVAEDGRADPDHRRAFLDGDLEIVAHAHRQLARASPVDALRPAAVAQVAAAARKYGRASSGSSTAGGSIISPTSAHGRQPRRGLDDRRQRRPAARHAWSVRPPRSTWTSSSMRRPAVGRRRRRASQQRRRCRPSG